MRQFLYRLSWDKEFKRKTLIISASCLGIAALLCLCIPIGVTAYVNYANSDKTETFDEEVKEGNKYNLIFNDKESQKDDKENQLQNKPNENKTQDSNNNNTESKSQEEEHEIPVPSYEHVHSWYKVVDSPAWSEVVQQIVGTQYRCNVCGFMSTSADAMNSHCSRLSHSFSSVPIYESRTIEHSEIFHYQCACGARQ